MFCPKCGKNGGGLCFTCFLEENPVRVKNAHLIVCGCGRVKHKQKWVKSVGEVLSGLTNEMLMFHGNVKVKEIKVFPGNAGKKIGWDACLKLVYGCGEHEKTFHCSADVVGKTCPSCAKKSAGYFEAILQVREKDPLIVPGERDVSDVKESKLGVDFYMKSVANARQIARQYKKRGYVIKESEKLFGKRDGRNIYRVSFSVKPPIYSVGDIVSLEGKLYQVSSVGANTRLTELALGDKTVLPSRDDGKIRVIAGKDDFKEAIISTVTPSHTQVIELSTGKIFDVPPQKRFEQGEEVHLILNDGLAHIIKKKEI